MLELELAAKAPHFSPLGRNILRGRQKCQGMCTKSLFSTQIIPWDWDFEALEGHPWGFPAAGTSLCQSLPQKQHRGAAATCLRGSAVRSDLRAPAPSDCGDRKGRGMVPRGMHWGRKRLTLCTLIDSSLGKPWKSTRSQKPQQQHAEDGSSLKQGDCCPGEMSPGRNLRANSRNHCPTVTKLSGEKGGEVGGW